MSETFIKINSLQHLEISRQTYPTNLSKICCSSRFRDIHKSRALIKQILNEVALIQVLRKRVSFKDRVNENTPKFPSVEI